MGHPYRERFKVGVPVRIAPRDVLVRFQRPAWRFHHPLSDAQVKCAGGVHEVVAVGFYHGGDVVYELDGVVGVWHEDCLSMP